MARLSVDPHLYICYIVFSVNATHISLTWERIMQTMPRFFFFLISHMCAQLKKFEELELAIVVTTRKLEKESPAARGFRSHPPLSLSFFVPLKFAPLPLRNFWRSLKFKVEAWKKNGAERSQHRRMSESEAG